MIFSALDRSRRGVVACVFDTTDRVQHMFFAQKHGHGQILTRHRIPLSPRRRTGGPANYLHRRRTWLFALSDHGFRSSERAVDLNGWLLQNGYLALKEGESGESLIQKDVDWSRTSGSLRHRAPAPYANELVPRMSHRSTSPTRSDQSPPIHRSRWAPIENQAP